MGNILSMDGICKSFSGIQVLRDVGLELEAGQIICLAGENGAGKSTLIKKLCAEFPAISFSVSATTRSPRPGERPGIDYHFLSREEFLDVFFDDLALPNLVKTQLARIHEYKSQRAGFTNDGTPANINVVRSLRGALGRRLALASPYSGKLRELQSELKDYVAEKREESQERKAERRARHDGQNHRAHVLHQRH